MARSSLLAALLLSMPACTSATGPIPPPRDDAGGSRAVEPAAATPTVSVEPAEPTEDGARGGLTITNFVPGTFVIESDDAVALRTRARIERRGADGQWLALETLDMGEGYRLQPGCGAAAPACVELAPGVPLLPVPLSGMSCSSQCNVACDKNVWLGPVELRLSIDRCDGGTIAGPPMRLGPVGGERLLERRVRSATRKPLDAAALAQLVALLEDPRGFDDDIQKRCATDHLVGFQLVREPATTGTVVPDRVDMAIDFRCNRLLFAHGGGDGRPKVEGFSYFDPSRAGWLSLVRAALPDDRELARIE